MPCFYRLADCSSALWTCSVCKREFCVEHGGRRPSGECEDCEHTRRSIDTPDVERNFTQLDRLADSIDK